MLLKRVLIFAATAVLALVASGGSAFANDGQAICVGGPSRPITTPNSHGKCKKGRALVTLVTQRQVGALQAQVATLQGQLSAGANANAALTGEVSSLRSDSGTLKSEVSSLQSDNATLKSEVSALQTTLSKVSYRPQGIN